ncbi:DUF4189 domain-containing protein [Luteibacter pinisoli]|uniref:DUF4189 domain-containing protein n=1 Tax=Luteibacter pinisoli TaxID=2589080 RepID=A0A4Y5Z394_9GAMM|nr:DUF4189 domain-containing protein [Luteibacter pinisoli]
MFSLARLPFFILLIVSCSTYAEGGCPPGQVPQQGNGWMACVPSGSASPSGSSSEFVGPSYEARWIALATDNAKALLGKSSESRTEDAAKGSAMSDCVTQGGTACHVVVTAKNGCVAMVVGDHRLATESAPTKKAAEDKATQSCVSNPDTNCSLYYSACVAPILR